MKRRFEQIMGVLRHTIMYKYWSEMCGVTWKDEEALQDNLWVVASL